jgi:cytochrome c553
VSSFTLLRSSAYDFSPSRQALISTHGIDKEQFVMSHQKSNRTVAAAIVVGVLLVAIGFAAVYGIAEWKMRRHYDAPLVPLQASSPPDLAEGERMARIVGCWDGCHGRTGQGGHEEVRGIVRHTAPTLSQVLPQYSDEELVRLIRYGVKRNGQSAVGMTSFSFWTLSDQDITNIVAHLRRQPSMTPVERNLDLTWRGRWALATGSWKVSAEQVDRSRPRWGDQPQTTPFERGRYLASLTCSACHGLDYRGDPNEGAPSLAILASYTLEQFTHLMRTGEPLGNRKLDENMTWVADAPFTDQEIAGLYEFLRTHHGIRP